MYVELGDPTHAWSLLILLYIYNRSYNDSLHLHISPKNIE